MPKKKHAAATGGEATAVGPDPAVAAAPQSIVDLYDFSETPFGGADPVKIERDLKVKLEVFDKDPRIHAYPFRVSGSDEAVASFLEKYESI